MYPNQSSNQLKIGRIVSVLLVLILVLGTSMVGTATQPEPDGAISGIISLPPEAMYARVNLPTEKTVLSSKLDSTLANLAEATSVSTLYAVKLADANMVRRAGDRIQVQVVTTPDKLENTKKVIEDAGGEVTGVGWGDDLIQGWLPVQSLEIVAANPQVDYLRLPEQVTTLDLEAGTQTTEGLAVINGPAWHSAGFQGAGVKVAIIDGGFQDYPGLLGNDLPGSVTVKNFVDGETDPQVNGTTIHGTACAEIVYDIAPQATIYLAKVGTNIDLQEAVTWAKSNSVDVISTSLVWYNLTPGDGTGYFANMVQDARNNGILWATAAGNDREAHWGGAFNDSNGDTYHEFNGTQFINYFGPGNGDAYLINPGFNFRVYLRWDDWTNHNQDYDLLLLRFNGSTWDTVASSTNRQNGGAGQTPTEFAAYVTSGPAAPYGFAIKRYSSNRNVNMEIFAPKMARLDELVYPRSLANLADSPEAVTVAALDVNSPFAQEPYSSEGPTNGPGGTAEGGFIKPDISGFANVSTVSYGTSSKFNGTSAATPHVAGAAALVQSANPGYTPAQIESFLTGRAIDMGAVGKDTIYGYGRLYLGAPPVDEIRMVFLPLLIRNPVQLPPAAPTNLVATASSAATIDLTWSDNASNEDGFAIERSPDGLSWAPLTTVGANVTSYQDGGLQSNTTYHYRLRAYLGALYSDYSNSASATTQNSCTPLYFDNFSNPASGWPAGDNGNVLYGYDNSEYRMLVRPTQWWGAARPGFQATDYIVAVDLRNPGSVLGSYGIVFGIAPDWSTLYSLEIYPNGWYGIYRWDPSAFFILTEGFSPAILQGNAINQIKVERNGASIKAYANGQLLASVTDSTYAGSRYLGAVVISYSQPNVDIRFDNFTVYPIGCGGSGSPSNTTRGWQMSTDQHFFSFNRIVDGPSKHQR